MYQNTLTRLCEDLVREALAEPGKTVPILTRAYSRLHLGDSSQSLCAYYTPSSLTGAQGRGILGRSSTLYNVC